MKTSVVALASVILCGPLASEARAEANAAPDPETLHIASTFPTNMPLLGEGVRALAAKIGRATGESLVLEFHEPDALVPAAQSVNAVADGRVDAAWAGAGWLANRDSAFNFFSTVPFGPDIGEYLAWMYDGGGLELAREMFHRQGIHNIPCLLVPPEVSGFFKKEIKSIDDLKGLRMRFFGLGAKVMEKLGVDTVQLAPGDIRQGMEDGSLDAAEFSLPIMDEMLELHKVANFYYFPGWHQQATFFDLYIAKPRWDALSDQHKEIIELACGDTIRESVALGEARQWQVLQAFRDRGVEIRRWAPEILMALDDAWQQLVVEESEKNPNFARVYQSYDSFRSHYAFWKYMGYLQ